MTVDAGSECRLPVVVTMGEPAGIGGEIILKAWLRRREGLPPFVVVDDADRLARLAVRLGLDVPVERCASLKAGKLEALRRRDTLPVLHCALARPVVPGRPDPANAAAVVRAVELAVQLVKAGSAAALVTAPIH